MSTGTTHQPRLPKAPEMYDRAFIDNLTNLLRQYFVTLDTPSVSAASYLFLNPKTNLKITASPTSPLNINSSALPTQTSLSSLNSGDIYYDTSAGNVLKIKP